MNTEPEAVATGSNLPDIRVVNQIAPRLQTLNPELLLRPVATTTPRGLPGPLPVLSFIDTQWKMFPSLDSKLPSQPKFESIHLTTVCNVIVAAEMKQPMQNKLSDFLVEGETVLSRLPHRLLH
jgi:hypothetical protein